MGLVEEFEKVIEEAEKLEQVSIPMRLKRRIANAYATVVMTLTDPYADQDATRLARLGIHRPLR